MAMRNFWIECDIDGRKNPLSGGPRRKDGGFTAKIKMRSEGESFVAMQVNGYVDVDGELVLEVYNHKGDRLATKTER